MAEDDAARRGGSESDWETYRRLLGYARPYWKRLSLGILFGVLFGGSTAGIILSLMTGLDHMFGDSTSLMSEFVIKRVEPIVDPEGYSLAVTLIILLLMPLFVALRGVGFFLSKYFVEWTGHRVVMDIRNELFVHIQDLSLFDLGQSRTGELMSRTASDTQLVERGVSTVIGDLAREPFVLLAAIVTLLALDARLALISLILFPLCILPVAILGRKVRRFAREGQARLGDLASVQQETITGSRVVKAFGREEDEKRRFGRFAREVFRRQVRVTRARAAVTPIVELVSILTFAALLFYARSAGMDLGVLLLFLGMLVLMYDPTKKLSRLHLGIQQAAAASDRIFEILDMEISVADRPEATPFTGEVEEICFENVSFRYGEEPVLQDVRLDVKAGECIAFVGSSGSGKTTLVGLLPRFYDVTKGRVTVNGTDIRDLTLESLRRCIGLVTQETVLFNRSVFENIAYGLPDALREAVEKAAHQAHADEFIRALPRGYETIIGERGSRLSGGERQRLAIARAMLRNPPILILDEATSALDSESERHVQAALDKLMEGRTVFAIAHRLSTIQHADRICVLKDGRIIEEGTHESLIRTDGAYKYFYGLQSAGTET
jgi:subfamily B ATP-binding cassette protein MsbA